MFIVWGSGMYGKVDEIPEIGYVRTKFGHLYYFPLIPTASYFVTQEAGDQFAGSSLPLNVKSILKAYIWSGLVVAAVGCIIVGGATLTAPIGAVEVAVATIMILGSIAAAYFSGRIWSKASYQRAVEIADQLNFDPQLKIYIDLQYEQISEQEADDRLDELSSDLDELDDLTDEIAASGLDQTFTTN